MIFAGMGGRMQALLFPAALQIFQACRKRLDDLLPPAFVLRPRLNIRITFSRQWRVDVDFVRAIKERIEAKELFLSQRVIFVIVTSSTTERETQPNRAHHGGAVDNLLDAVFL